MPRISSKNQVTLPVDVLARVGLKAGDDIRIEEDADDRVVITRVDADPRSAIGVFDGLYPPDYLNDLRSGERA